MSAWSRSFAIIALGYVLLLLRSIAWAAFELGPFTPQLVLPIVIFLGVSPDVLLVRGAAIAWSLGYLSDNFCGLPMSLHTFLIVATYLIARATGLRLFLRGPGFQIGLTFFATLLFGLAATGVRAVFEAEAPLPIPRTGATTFGMIATALTSALLSPLVFGAVQAIEDTALGRRESARA